MAREPALSASKPGRLRGRRLGRDAVAGFINAVVSVPDGLASAALAGVNPVYGLYTSIAAPITGSALVSTQLMQIATTSASALAAGQAITTYPAQQQSQAMFLLVVLTGLFLGLFALLRLGRLVRFVSHAVMTGFISGVAAVLVLDQLAPLVGVTPHGSNEVAQFVDLVAHWAQFDFATAATGVLAIILAVGLGRTRLAPIASLVALVVPSLLVIWLASDSVRRVRDVAEIPPGLPLPALPDLALLSPQLAFAAFAIAVVIAIQAAGISQVFDNPDGSRPDASRDMLAQGAANVAAGLMSGIPAGGSVGQTALNVRVGACSRWSGIFGGVWMLAIVLLVPSLVSQVPMAVLAALMIVSGISALDVTEVRSIWRTGRTARWSILVTFAATLVLSIPTAVGVGVALSIILNLASAASDVAVRALTRRGDGRIEEGAPPARLPSDAVTVLDVYGSLFFAGARTLEDQLPRPEGSSQPVVVLRLRGRTKLGATLLEVLDRYAEDLADSGGRLYLSGVAPDVAAELRRTGKLDLDGVVHVAPSDEVIGASTSAAVQDARAWLGRNAKRSSV
jgi:SulP family sulfate permease